MEMLGFVVGLVRQCSSYSSSRG